MTCNTRKLIFHLMIFTIINVLLFRGCRSIKVNISSFNFRGGYKDKKEYERHQIYDKYYIHVLYYCYFTIRNLPKNADFCPTKASAFNPDLASIYTLKFCSEIKVLNSVLVPCCLKKDFTIIYLETLISMLVSIKKNVAKIFSLMWGEGGACCPVY